jgi:hypothetical protein
MKAWVNGLAGLLALIAAALWFYSAKVAIWADGRQGPRGDNMVIWKNGRLYDVTGTAAVQSRWSAYAAVAAGLSALLQTIGLWIND